MPEWEADHCPVCNKVVGWTGEVRLSEEAKEHFKDQLWKPGDPIPEITGDGEKSKLRKDIEELLKEQSQ